MSFSQSLAKRNLHKGADDHSKARAEEQRLENLAIEAAIVEVENEVDGGVSEMKAIADEVEYIGEELVKADAVEGGLTDVVQQTIETYGEDGITEQGAQLLQVSVEAVLRSAGLNIPVSTMVPSFESGMSRVEYSAEAEEKSKGVLARIGEWVATAFKALIDAISRFINSFRTNVSSVSDYVKKVRVKVEKSKGDGKAGNVKLSSEYMPANAGKPAENLTHIVSTYQKFVGTWDGTWGPLTKIGAFDTANVQKMHDSSKAWLHNGVGHLTKLKFLPTHQLTVKGGTAKIETSGDLYPLIGATIEFERVEKADGRSELPALSKSEQLAGLAKAEDALKVCETVEKKVDQWIKAGKETISKARTIGFITGANAQALKDDPNPYKSLQAKQASMFFKSLVGAQRVISAGWSKSLYHLLSAIRANVQYVARSVGGAEGEEKPQTLNTVDNPNHAQIGHDKSGSSAKSGRVGETYEHA